MDSSISFGRNSQLQPMNKGPNDIPPVPTTRNINLPMNESSIPSSSFGYAENSNIPLQGPWQNQADGTLY